MTLSMIDYEVLNLIPHGASHSMTTANISKITGLSVRDIREAVSTLINFYGVPIVAIRTGHNMGMFIATDEIERDMGITAFRSQVNTMNTRIKAIERADLDGWESTLQPEIRELQRTVKTIKEAN